MVYSLVLNVKLTQNVGGARWRKSAFWEMPLDQYMSVATSTIINTVLEESVHNIIIALTVYRIPSADGAMMKV